MESNTRSINGTVRPCVHDIKNDSNTKGKNAKMEITVLKTMVKTFDKETAGRLSNLRNEISKLSNEVNEIDVKLMAKTEQDMKQLKINHQPIESNETTDNDEGNISERMTKMGRHLERIDLNQQIYENVTHNGRMIWKIDDLSARLRKSISGEQKVIYSAPCFTSYQGYKFCARIYLNGDGIGQNTHVSLFFVLMKSEYDNLLEWPFNKRISFTLLNLENTSKSIQETIQSDIYSSSFQKPHMNLNKGVGLPLLIEKNELFRQGFVKDNAMFIEIKVT